LAAKRKQSGKKPSRPPQTGGGRSATSLRVRRLPSGEWELVHPRCARDRADDVDEVRKMVEAGEVDIALDELRWLLNGCSDFVDAHRLLAELALSENDLPLARAHFGYAFTVGEKAMKQAGATGPLPYRIPANQGFHEAGKGLVHCLKKLGKHEMARHAAEFLVKCDPSDPLAVRVLLERRDEPPSGMQLPVIQ
jgi:hypothetical protein